MHHADLELLCALKLFLHLQLFDFFSAAQSMHTLYKKKPPKNLYLKLKKQYPSFSEESLEKIYLFKKLHAGRISASESVRLSYLAEMITEADYLDYLKIEREAAET